jgi:RNA polymerase sigma-70 factor, ECF subfamily
MSMAPTDQELIERVRIRDEAAFELLSDRYREAVRRHLLRTVRDPDAAQDLLQEVLLRVWTRADQWDGRGSFRAWLFRVATNLALNHLRTVRRRRQQPLELPPDRPVLDDEERDEGRVPAWMVDTATLGPDAAVERAERHALLRRLVGELPEEKREVFRLIHDAELEIRQVAEVLSIPEGTVKSRLYYANKRIVQQWRDLEDEL